MENPKIDVFIETKPENYYGNISITINRKKSEKLTVDLLVEILENLEGWDIKYDNNI